MSRLDIVNFLTTGVPMRKRILPPKVESSRHDSSSVIVENYCISCGVIQEITVQGSWVISANLCEKCDDATSTTTRDKLINASNAIKWWRKQ